MRNREDKMDAANVLLYSSSGTRLFYTTSVTDDKHNYERVQIKIETRLIDEMVNMSLRDTEE